MKLIRPLMLLLLVACSTIAFAQPNQEVNLCINLSEILELQAMPNNRGLITFDVDSKNKWEFGMEPTDYNEFSVCATTDWKITSQVIGNNGDDIDEINGNGGKLPLACVGTKIIWNGTNQIGNYLNITQPLSQGTTTVLEPAAGQSNIGGPVENNFIVWWNVGQWQLPGMPDESLLEKQVKAGTYKFKVVYTLLPAI